jgi:hypothetical protein
MQTNPLFFSIISLFKPERGISPWLFKLNARPGGGPCTAEAVALGKRAADAEKIRRDCSGGSVGDGCRPGQVKVDIQSGHRIRSVHRFDFAGKIHRTGSRGFRAGKGVGSGDRT